MTSLSKTVHQNIYILHQPVSKFQRDNSLTFLQDVNTPHGWKGDGFIRLTGKSVLIVFTGMPNLRSQHLRIPLELPVHIQFCSSSEQNAVSRPIVNIIKMKELLYTLFKLYFF